MVVMSQSSQCSAESSSFLGVLLTVGQVLSCSEAHGEISKRVDD